MSKNKTDYAELESILRNWMSIKDDAVYDFVGMAHLFRVCLLNLMEYSMEADWLVIHDIFRPEELEFLRKMSDGFGVKSESE